jgi:hypothetical protein
MSIRATTAVLALTGSALFQVRCATDDPVVPPHGTHDAAPEADAPNADAHDATGESDAPDGDALPNSQVPCDKLLSVWKDFVQQNRACTTAKDCALVGGADNWCSCGYAIGDPGGDPISAGAVPDTQSYLDRFKACRAENYPFGCANDHGPATNLRCESGVCRADPQYCGFPDVAPPDDSGADADASDAEPTDAPGQ